MKLAPPAEQPLWLASRSQRRRHLLEAAGVPFHALPARIDDGTLRSGPVRPEYWVAALAYLKARWVVDALTESTGGAGTVLGADTLCVHEGRILGQPGAAASARDMLVHLRDATHVTMTGVCLISLADGRRWLGVDRARVRIGHVGDDELDAYVTSGQWRGKAGAYNLADRIDAGWPIDCEGDPATVMGLPMRRLEPWFSPLRQAREEPSS
ncbi:MAG: Maf-like protein [Planctomycetes bacterium]|nr:Maf-like protein [Planctomycetota bacterium]